MIEEKWKQMSLGQQMGNIGSEFSRMINLKKKGNSIYAENSFDRLIELLDLTISQRKSRELLILKEVLEDLFFDRNKYKVSADSLRKYFINFALIK